MGIQPVQVMSSRAGANRPPRQRVPRPHVATATPVPSALTLDDVAAAVSELAADLFPGQGNEPLEPLDRFRRGLIADAAVVWAVDGGRVRPVLHAGAGQAPTEPEFDAVSTALERLRHNDAIWCQPGDVCGVEDLVPGGARSFVAAAAVTRGRVLAALIIGWQRDELLCDRRAARLLRLAATLVAQALDQGRTQSSSGLTESILESLTARVAVLDRDATIVAVNAAWTEFVRSAGADAAGAAPGATYLDLWRRAAAAGHRDAELALHGVEEVLAGTRDAFELGYEHGAPDSARRARLTVTPLRRPGGGAVVVHEDVSMEPLAEAAVRATEERIYRLADALPVPVWRIDADGRLEYGNQAWADAIAGAPSAALHTMEWMQAIHEDDLAMFSHALQSAIDRRDRLDVELRLRSRDGGYRWWAFLASPHFSADGQLDVYVGSCADVTARRHAQQVLHEVGARLVAAQEAERGRIARELHDDLGQQVALLASKLEAVVDKRAFSRNRINAGLAEARKALQELAVSIHNLSHELHPAKLKLLGLEQTLEALCRDVGTESGRAIHFRRAAIPPEVSEDTALCVFRVTQEALQNAVKHSGAQRIDVALLVGSSNLMLRITDDGTGFDTGASQPSGIGLLTMRERVELIGGRLRVETAPGSGTTIEAIVPMMPAPGDAGVPV